MTKKPLIYAITGFALGIIAMIAATQFGADDSDSSDSKMSAKNEPLYWVAPMDANYRRDKPGKSPMGMDLVPVYEEGGDDEDTPGTIKIHPKVINNLSVKTGQVQKSALIDRLNTVGYITYDETTLTHIHSRTDGWIEKLYVSHNGQYIDAGQPLYTLYSPALVNAQQEYLLAKKRNNQSLLLAAKQRLKSLGFSSDELQKINQTGKPLQNVTFYAEADGVIDNLNVREGFFIKPGTRFMTIGSLDTVWVEVELFARQTPYVNKGQTAKMKLDYLPSKSWLGTVDYIYPMVDSTNRTAKVRLEFDNPEHQLKPNMFADIAINTKTDEMVLQVPQSAVIRTEDNNRVVLALGDGKFKSVSVDIGRTTNNSVEILSGLVEGDNVVLSGQFLIDSESSIESDFKRFTDSDSKTISNMLPSARVTGLVNSIDRQRQTVNISRGAIEKWNRDPMTMDFDVGSSVSLDKFRVGETIDFTFEVRDSGFFITQLHHDMKEHQHD
ncbi:efflux RND transporter periplasmic adaptor subunit [Kangiella marina]|uniref:Efflux RND transporter periplasmic adaptor subunit n=1 Tax=Kangiella marina TaxID=1079178 RepID=A0ABP8IAK1_9GAMM